MSKTLSVLILENFVITEGPKWDKFKKGVKKVGRGAVTAATVGAVALGGYGGAKIHNANRNYKTDMAISRSDYEGRKDGLERNYLDSHRIITNQANLTPEINDSLKERIDRIHNRNNADNMHFRDNRDKGITKTRDRARAEGKEALVVSGGLAVAPLLAGVHAAGARSEKKKQAGKSLKERLELVKSGMLLNEESDDITALRNKINQGLIILPGLKGSAADKMEDAIRSWEDQINKLKNKIGEKYE